MARSRCSSVVLLGSALGVSLLGCGNGQKSPGKGPAVAAMGGGAGAAATPLGGAGSGGGGGGLVAAVSGAGSSGAPQEPPQEPDVPWVDPYPRAWAEPALTRALATGEVKLLGKPLSACSNQLPAAGDRWCAFARAPEQGPASLWVVNVTRVAAGLAAACDQESESCIKLSDSLWTGEDVWGASHPFTHRFDGDTLIFHADGAEPTRHTYQGTIHAWRPGWPAARPITNAQGVTCTGHRRTPAVYCFQSLDVEERMAGDFGPPVWHSFDLMAGLLDDAPMSLGLVEHITVPVDQPYSFAVQLDRAGEHLAFSSVPPGADREALRYVPLDELGNTPPATVLDNASQWVLSNDGKAVYALRDYDREQYLGELIVADFPSGQRASTIASSVFHIDPAGEDDAPLTDEDRGVGYDVETERGSAFDFLKDRTMPGAVQRLGDGVSGPRLAPTGSHTFLFQDTGEPWPLAQVIDHATNEACTLNRELTAETYGGRFTRDGRRAAWIEFGSAGSEAGYTANLDCSDAVKFGDWVLDYQLQDALVIFEGGDDMDSTSYLEYARLPSAAGQAASAPLHVCKEPSFPVASFTLADGTYLAFGASFGSPSVPGLYLHGPLEAALAPP